MFYSLTPGWYFLPQRNGDVVFIARCCCDNEMNIVSVMGLQMCVSCCQWWNGSSHSHGLDSSNGGVSQCLNLLTGSFIEYVDEPIVASAYNHCSPLCKCDLFWVCLLWICVVCSNTYGVVHSVETESVNGIIDDKTAAPWIYSSASAAVTS